MSINQHMTSESFPFDERLRQQEVESYSILNSLPEKDYDNLVHIVAQICQTPISFIIIIDNNRQWFKSRIGIDDEETPRNTAFCNYAIRKPGEIFVVKDARLDERFSRHKVVVEENVVFYAGVPLVSESGLPVGALCVMDREPRELSPDQEKSLKALSRQVMRLLELRRSKILLQETLSSLQLKNEELEHFAYVAAHDIKSPLNNITGLSELLIKTQGAQLPEEDKEVVEAINTSAKKLSKLVQGLLDYSKNDNILKENISEIKPEEISQYIRGLYSMHHDDLEFQTKATLDYMQVNRIALEQILINLVSNAIKYNDKDVIKIELYFGEDTSHYHMHVRDNGPGVPEEHKSRIFKAFETVGDKDRFGDYGSGMGLATVKKLVYALGGTISLHTPEQGGAEFRFSVEKS